MATRFRIIFRNYLNILAAAFCSAIVSNSASADATYTTNKPNFYTGMPFGSVAIVRNAESESIARSARRYRVLSESGCNPIGRNRQYIVVNHRSLNHQNRRAFFSIRIAHFDVDNTSADRADLHLYRNRSDWYSLENKPVSDFSKQPDQISVSVKDFLELHRLSEESSVARKQVRTQVGIFHALLGEEKIDTWERRSLIGGDTIRDIVNKATRFSVRHFGHRVTAKNASRYPVIFDLAAHRSDRAVILVDSSIPGIPSKSYIVHFDESCDSD